MLEKLKIEDSQRDHLTGLAARKGHYNTFLAVYNADFPYQNKTIQQCFTDAAQRGHEKILKEIMCRSDIERETAISGLRKSVHARQWKTTEMVIEYLKYDREELCRLSPRYASYHLNR